MAANLRALGAEPVLVGRGRTTTTRATACATRSAQRGVDTARVIRDPARPTTVKTRIIAHSQQVVRADRESRADLDGAALAELLDGARARAAVAATA